MDYIILFVILFLVILLFIQSSRRAVGTTSEVITMRKTGSSFSPKVIPPSQYNDSNNSISSNRSSSGSSKTASVIGKASSTKNNKVYDMSSLAGSGISTVTCDPKSTASSGSILSGAIKQENDYYYVGEPQDTQIFHVYNNVYTYKEAQEECAKRASQLADPSQLQNAYTKGADWCSWGWASDGNAYLPNKSTTCNKEIGLLNGKNIDPFLRMGTNCYGVPK